MVLVSLNEAIWGGDKKRVGAYKAMITDKYRALEKKFRDAVMVPNYTNLVISTNEERFAPIGLTDRRHAVFDMSGERVGDTAYFKRLLRAIVEERGREVLLHELLNRKVDFDRMRQPPKWESEAGMTATMREADPQVSWLVEWLTEGETVTADGDYLELSMEERVRLDKRQVFDSYTHYVKTHRRFDSPRTPVAFWKKMRDLMPSIKEDRIRLEGGQRQRVVFLAPLPTLRAEVQTHVSKPIKWD